MICGVGLCSGIMLGIGNAFVAYGFNEPLTITQRCVALAEIRLCRVFMVNSSGFFKRLVAL